MVVTWHQTQTRNLIVKMAILFEILISQASNSNILMILNATSFQIMTACSFLHFKSSRASSKDADRPLASLPALAQKSDLSADVSGLCNVSLLSQSLQINLCSDSLCNAGTKLALQKHFPAWCKSRSSPTGQQHKERRIYYNNHDSSKTNAQPDMSFMWFTFVHVSLLIIKLLCFSFMAIISLHVLSLANRQMTASLVLAINAFIWYFTAHWPSLMFAALLGHCSLRRTNSRVSLLIYLKTYIIYWMLYRSKDIYF